MTLGVLLFYGCHKNYYYYNQFESGEVVSLEGSNFLVLSQENNKVYQISTENCENCEVGMFIRMNTIGDNVSMLPNGIIEKRYLHPKSPSHIWGHIKPKRNGNGKFTTEPFGNSRLILVDLRLAAGSGDSCIEDPNKGYKSSWIYVDDFYTLNIQDADDNNPQCAVVGELFKENGKQYLIQNKPVFAEALLNHPPEPHQH